MAMNTPCRAGRGRRAVLARWLLVTAVALSPAARAWDLVAEQAIARTIAGGLETGGARWLAVGDRQVLAVFGESRREPVKGAVLLLHDIGGHADWPGVVRPLRTALPQYGWHTLSVQRPMWSREPSPHELEDALAEETARVRAALAFLKARGVSRVVVVGHGRGAGVALEILAKARPREVVALVAVNAADSAGAPMVAALDGSDIPVLDLYGTRDPGQRLLRMQPPAPSGRPAGNPAYLELAVEGADRNFNGQADVLVKRVRGWLDKLGRNRTDGG
jgi:pimeloyl-ACP methyl ester carboxylesterase